MGKRNSCVPLSRLRTGAFSHEENTSYTHGTSLFTEKSKMNLTDHTVMRSCYKTRKISSNAQCFSRYWQKNNYIPNCEISFASFGVNEHRQKPSERGTRCREYRLMKGIRIPEFGKVLFVESEIQLKESGIPLKMDSWIKVPLKKKTGTQYLESGIHGMESRI